MKVWIIIAFALNNDGLNAWEAIQPMLSNNDENIRRFACLYVTKIFSRRQQLIILAKYTMQGQYFYNVVTLLDRALFAPPAMASIFAEEERAFFLRWVKSGTYNWPDLTLEDRLGNVRGRNTSSRS
jgi:hypothetical protein